MSVQTKSNLLPSGLTLGPLGGAVCSGPARDGDGEEGGAERGARGRRGTKREEERGHDRERERVTKEEEEVVADLNLSGGPLRA